MPVSSVAGVRIRGGRHQCLGGATERGADVPGVAVDPTSDSASSLRASGLA